MLFLHWLFFTGHGTVRQGVLAAIVLGDPYMHASPHVSWHFGDPHVHVQVDPHVHAFIPLTIIRLFTRPYAIPSYDHHDLHFQS